VLHLGTFSYSLYLMHVPVLTVVTLVGISLGITSIPAYLFMVAVGIPLALIFTYLFHLIFERPFMPTHLAQHEAPTIIPRVEVEVR
jgi:peptidoglycan/LPS O-acetylase OafA/YrhL